MQIILPVSKGGHDYNDLMRSSTSDCNFGCEAWMGIDRSDAPEGIDPFGKCPKNPQNKTPKAKLTVRKRQMGKLRFGCKIEKVPVRICVIRPTTSITETDGEILLKIRFEKLRKKKIKFFVLDMSRSQFICNPLGTLVWIMAELQKVGGKIVLCCLNDKSREKMRYTALDGYFQIFPTLESALQSFE